MLKYLPDSYHRHLIGSDPKPMTERVERVIRAQLKEFGLQDMQDNTEVVSLPIPEGFGSITEELETAYDIYNVRWDNLLKLISSKPKAKPSSFYAPEGWSYWNGERWVPHTAPSNRTFVADTETVEVTEGQWHPTCMVLMSASGWMCWKADMSKVAEVSCVPFGTGNTILGYNVSYERSYMSSEYLVADSGNEFFDLMSMWTVTHGMTSQQRAVFLKFDKPTEDDIVDFSKPKWVDDTSTNSLSAAYEFYTGKELDKGVRDLIAPKGKNVLGQGLRYSMDNMTDIIRYCADDVLATFELATHLVPEYSLARPSNISRYGAIARGKYFLPLAPDRFDGYYDRVEAKYQESSKNTNEAVMEAFYQYWVKYPTQDVAPLAAQTLDWEPAKVGKTKGQPKWYRDAVSAYKRGDLDVTQRSVVIVLGLEWFGEPVFWDGYGWTTKTRGAIPHPEKRGKRVTTMFLKGFVEHFESGVISCADETKALVLEKVSFINWVSTRKRVQGIHTESLEGFPVVVPMIAVNGTVTGRAKDNLWQVTANPKKSRVGTELKSMIAPPCGYVFVGADVDSEEAWLSGLHGDELLGYCASTPFGAINAIGSSKTKTDIHSLVSIEQFIPRDVAKVLNYGTLYGAGVKGNADVLMKTNPALEVETALASAKKFIQYLKGYKNYDDGTYSNGLASDAFTKMELLADSRKPVTPLTGAWMSKALSGVDDFKTTRVNWVVQASGVDFLDMLVLLTNSFYKKLGVVGRLVLTVHDEIRTMVKNEHTTKAIYALQLAHLYTRSAFIRAHALDNIPAGQAWFSAVDVDATCLRKDPSDPQVTPTQDALPLGYTVNAQQLQELLCKL